ncbi:MAG: Ldh family oxidoreductase [Chloroflexota bacterium]|nr:Ldh family oxidoreductase [Chloroflexota bacterium]
MIWLKADDERRLVRDLLLALGASHRASDDAAADIVEADLRGHDSHGLARLELQVRLIRGGTVNPAAEPVVEEARPGSLVVDGRTALGARAVIFGVQAAIERALDAGSCAATIHSHGYAAYYGYYAELGIEQDCIVLVCSKSSRWNVHAYGGVQPVLGSDPLAIGIPTNGDPLLLDMSTAAAANGKLLAAARAGQSIPAGLAIDSEGRPTTDPRVAMQGATSPFGGAKGYGLGLVVEMLGGLLARAGVGAQVDEQGRTRPWSSSAIVLYVGAFIDPAEFRRQTSEYLRRVKGSRVAPGFEEILVPGERAYRTRRERLASGIPIPDDVWEAVWRLARSVGVEANGHNPHPNPLPEGEGTG